jgi:hypothetical protein
MGAMKLPRPFPASRFVAFIEDHPKLTMAEVSNHRTTLEKWERENTHFTFYEADRRATLLGFHGSEIWGWDEWINATLGDSAT